MLQASILLLVQYAISPSLPQALSGATLQLDLPRPLGQPAKVLPAASWLPNQRVLSWDLHELKPGAKGACRACFMPQYANPALAAAGVYGGDGAVAAFDVKATFQFYGAQGQTLSGVTLESGTTLDKRMPGNGSWQGIATAVPNR